MKNIRLSGSEQGRSIRNLRDSKRCVNFVSPVRSVQVTLVVFLLALQVTSVVSLSWARGALPQGPGRNKKQAITQDSAASSSVLAGTIEIEVGHAHVMKVASARQVAVGNSQTLQATAPSAKEVILFGKRAGMTSVDIWDQHGHRQSFQVVVHAAGRSQTIEDVRSLLKGLEGVRVLTAGSHILLQADALTSAQRQVVERVLARFPDVVDMTSTMSWDPMVLLDVMVIEMPTYKLSELGVRWQSTEGSGGFVGLAWQAGRSVVSGQDGTPMALPAQSAAGAGNAAAQVGKTAAWIGSNTGLHAQIQAMADRGEAILLAKPQLMTRSGKSASFLAGGEVPYALTDTKGRTHTEFKKYGVSLNVTPEIAEQGRITASVEVEVSAVDPSIVTPAGPAMRVRKASTQFNAYSGQTMVLAGFMSSDRSNSYRGAPSPEGTFIERLTGVQDDRSRQTELAILVTPVITAADDPSMRHRVRRAQTFAQVESVASERLLASVQHHPEVVSSDWIDDLDTALVAGPSGQDQWGTDQQVSASPWEHFWPATVSEQWVRSSQEEPGVLGVTK